MFVRFPLCSAATLALFGLLTIPAPGRELSEAETWAITGGQIGGTSSVIIKCCGRPPHCLTSPAGEPPGGCSGSSGCDAQWTVSQNGQVTSCMTKEIPAGGPYRRGNGCSLKDPKRLCSIKYYCYLVTEGGDCLVDSDENEVRTCVSGYTVCP